MAASTAAEFNLEQYIMHHVQNGHNWQLPFLPKIPLPGFLSLHALMLLLCASALGLFLAYQCRRPYRVPQGWVNVTEIFVLFVRDRIAVPSLGHEDGLKLTPVFCTFFVLILGLNLMGLIPVFSTATANINVTGALAAITLGFMIFGAVYKNGIKGFLQSFIPSGVPLPILFFLVPIEFLGLFIKAFALMIRLFANMLAGHIVILSLLGLVVLLGWVALPFVFLAVFISLLEVFISFLQAFIFTFLSALFIGQIYHPEH